MDFTVEHVVYAAPADVAKIMFDPDYEDQWVSETGRAERLSPGPLSVGSRVRHAAGVFGLKVSFVTEVTAIDAGHRLEMSIIEGPVHGMLVYEVAPTAGGAIAIVHVRDHANAPVPRAAWFHKHQITENLTRLSKLVARLHA